MTAQNDVICTYTRDTFEANKMKKCLVNKLKIKQKTYKLDKFSIDHAQCKRNFTDQRAQKRAKT